MLKHPYLPPMLRFRRIFCKVLERLILKYLVQALSSGDTHNRPHVKGDFAPPLFHRARMGKVCPRSRWLLSWVVRAQSQ